MSDWKLPYEQLVDSLTGATTSHGLRKDPRFSLDSNSEFQVQLGGKTAMVCDVSAGGMALYSEYLVPNGGEVALTVNNALQIHSEVVYCAPMGEWGPNNPPLHRMGLKFISENDGYRTTMLALGSQPDEQRKPITRRRPGRVR